MGSFAPFCFSFQSYPKQEHVQKDTHGLPHQKQITTTRKWLNVPLKVHVTEKLENVNALMDLQEKVAVVLFAQTIAVDMVSVNLLKNLHVITHQSKLIFVLPV